MSGWMVRGLRVLFFFLLVAVATDDRLVGGEEGGAPPARKIPGINAEDRFPRGCVDCHVNMPEQQMDVRLSTLLAKSADRVRPELLARVSAAAPAEVRLKGKHPVVAAALQDIPSGCLSCHGKGSKTAPPFAEMMHLIHLVGGEGNHFMTLFQGECTHCHKFDAMTGTWRVPSGPEM